MADRNGSDGASANGNGHIVLNNQSPLAERSAWGAIRTMVTNLVYDRVQAFQRWLDPRRDLNFECGYPGRTIDPDFYQELYERDPIAARVVEVFPKECWQVQPTVYEDDDPDTATEFEDGVDGLGAQLAGESYHGEEKGSLFWDVVKRADIASRICRHGCIVVGIDDGLPLNMPAKLRPYQPLKGNRDGAKGKPSVTTGEMEDEEDDGAEEGVDGGGGKSPTENQMAQFSTTFPYNPTYPGEEEELVAGLVKAKAGKGKGGIGKAERKILWMHVFPEATCRVQDYEQDPLSPRFGQPTSYAVTFGDPRQTMGPGMPLVQQTVHWTRVVPLAEDVRSVAPQGAAPAMEPVLNRLLDLRKVYGPDAEGYYRNGIPGWAFETHKELGSADLDKQSLKDNWEEYSNSMSRLMATEGGTLKPLTTSLADPKPHIEIQIEAICIKLGIPIRIFKGSERGELASSQDDAAWNDRLRERQNTYLTPRVICPVIDRLIALYVLPVPKAPDGYKVWWPDLESQGEAEKATIANTKVTALAAFFDPAKSLPMEVAPIDFWTRIMGEEEKEAKAIIKNAEKEKAKRQKEADELKVKEQEQQLAFQDAEARSAQDRDLDLQARQASVGMGTDEDPMAQLEGAVVENQETTYYGGFRYDPVTNTFCKTGKGGGIDPTCGGVPGGQSLAELRAERQRTYDAAVAAKTKKKNIELSNRVGEIDKQIKELEAKGKAPASPGEKKDATPAPTKQATPAPAPAPKPDPKPPREQPAAKPSQAQGKELKTDKARSDYAAKHADWGNDLSPAQQKALADYQREAYQKINKDLRAGKAPDKTAQDIDAAIKKSTIKEAVTVYRGVGANFDSSGMKPGAEFTDKGFVSTSMGKERAGLTTFSDAKTVFKINVPAGARAAVLNASPGRARSMEVEHEVLLPRNSKFRVVRVTEVNGKKVVEVEIVGGGSDA
jgi:hypothetical protein